ncbi:MAG: type III pantothenate kinase [Chloroflexi bacterium]|nr:type III pantothenate kinase [Chloroflexota bacterium]
MTSQTQPTMSRSDDDPLPSRLEETDDDGLLLAIDIGNTSIAIGVFDGDEVVGTFRVATDQENFPDEYAILLLGLLASVDIAPDDIGAAVMSSTVPPMVRTFQHVCRQHFEVEPLIVGPGVRTGIRVLYDNPREVGPDRILHAVAALDAYDPPMIIVDLGTACVFDAVSRDGDYLGGAIAPGIGLASQALFSRAAMLHRVSIEQPSGPIGRNTVHSMQSGIFFGYAEMVRGMVRRFKAEIGEEATVIGTGGYVSIIAEEAGCFDAIEHDLNLTGLRLVWEANR